MRVLESVRRLAAPVAGLVGAAALCLACSSTTGGAPASPASPAGGSISVPSVSTGVAVGGGSGTPSLSVPAISDLPSIGGSESGTAFCKDFSSFDPNSIGTDPSSALAIYDKLANDAPAAIKPDVEKIRDFLKGALNGHPDTSGTQDFQEAITNMTQYYAAHCVNS